MINFIRSTGNSSSIGKYDIPAFMIANKITGKYSVGLRETAITLFVTSVEVEYLFSEAAKRLDMSSRDLNDIDFVAPLISENQSF